MYKCYLEYFGRTIFEMPEGWVDWGDLKDGEPKVTGVRAIGVELEDKNMWAPLNTLEALPYFQKKKNASNVMKWKASSRERGWRRKRNWEKGMASLQDTGLDEVECLSPEMKTGRSRNGRELWKWSKLMRVDWKLVKLTKSEEEAAIYIYT